MNLVIDGYKIQYVDHTDQTLQTVCTAPESKDDFLKRHSDDEIRSVVYWSKLAAEV